MAMRASLPNRFDNDRQLKADSTPVVNAQV